MPTKRRLLLVDAYGLIYRAFHALPPLTNSRGQLTNAAYGFTSILLRTMADVDPERAIVAFDAPGTTYRHERFPAYKAQRPSMPDELRSQVPIVRDLVAALGLPLLEATGYEADDVIGTIATAAERDGWEVHIVSGDLDMLQLVTKKVHLMHTAKGGADAIVEYDPERVFARYGLTPEQMVDFKSLKGDSSDNIPGVPGVGEKTASKLIATFGSLEQLYARLDEVEPVRIRESLAANRDAAFAGQGLMTIDRDAPLALPATGGEIGVYDREAALALFRDLEFRALAQRLPPLAGEDRVAANAAVSAAAAGAALRGSAAPVAKAAPKVAASNDLQLGFNFDAVTAGNAAAGRSAQAESSATDESDVHAKIEQVKRGELAAAGIRVLRAADEARDAFRGLSSQGHLAIGGVGADRRGPEAELAIAIVDDAGTILAADDGAVVHALLESLASSKREIAGLGVKGLIGAMVSIRPDASPLLIDDVALGTWIANVTMRNPGLVEVASARLGADLPDRLEPLQEAVLAALVTRASRGPLAEELHEAGTLRLYREIELPLVEVLARMEIAGVAVDQKALSELSTAFGAEITRLEREAERSVGHPVALGSPKQLGELLFVELNLPKGKKTKTGAWSTDASVLEEIQGEHPIVGIAMEWRTVSKLQSTYVEALPKLVEADGRVHTTFQQAVAATGRLSSTDPNLQNIPIRTALGRKIRNTFIAEKGNTLVAADYSQIELRILAHVTRDEHLIAAFAAGEDIHRATAARVLGKSAADVDADERAMAKMVNFGIAYGMGDFGLATRAGISRDAAKSFIAGYFERYPGIRRYIDTIKEEARTNGSVTTQLGRRRPIPELRAGNPALRAAGERAAINHPIQGTAADVIKIAMIRLAPRLAEAGLKARLVLQVHDELLLEVPNGEIDRLVPILVDTMEGALALDVPLTVEVKSGPRWDEMKPWSARA
ncbi:MAG: DNA polymerase I [Candidatus Aquidulcis sp.]|nr:MAG: DNA polymerase I [Candidatus Aquidulcis sp.]